MTPEDTQRFSDFLYEAVSWLTEHLGYEPKAAMDEITRRTSEAESFEIIPEEKKLPLVPYPPNPYRPESWANEADPFSENSKSFLTMEAAILAQREGLPFEAALTKIERTATI